MLPVCLALGYCTGIAFINLFNIALLFLVYTTYSAAVQRPWKTQSVRHLQLPSLTLPMRTLRMLQQNKRPMIYSKWVADPDQSSVLTLIFSVSYSTCSCKSFWSYSNFSHSAKSLTIELQSWDVKKFLHCCFEQWGSLRRQRWLVPRNQWLWPSMKKGLCT